jgi:hypothetical protein
MVITPPHWGHFAFLPAIFSLAFNFLLHDPHRTEIGMTSPLTRFAE